ncbi:hypothetical protein GOARA_061_00940 [Gordonia araii NBRC 100433]|uniref:DinB-like domain-containing protein n=1 Tax=Gordonia araii NBRC 100433 TaxID=1073574 RepID=G7H480_9ACTN|nr:DinB family protein [Gordonia araii]NNG96286.1 DinB family protein [Gordonia araii NBRC 100433]GAB10655.1 hypothetical protein GOARA_061_00940 [Gordonia araii NBRC 100433]
MATDTKDWSVYAARRCDECGFDASAVDRDDIAAKVRVAANDWAGFLRDSEAGELRERPAPQVWSPLEYGVHVRDVIRLFTDRVGQMLTMDSPGFPGWDQEAAAAAARYNEQDPGIVAEEVAADGDRLGRVVDGLAAGDWDRVGARETRQFTVEFLLRYLLHDVMHHWHDVGGEI